MKRQFFYGLLLLLNFSLISSTCSSDNDEGPNNNASEIQQIKSDVESGTWRITSYIDSGQDETSDFNGYNFTFAPNGVLTADNGTSTESGTWSITDSSSSSSSSDDDIDFNIFFNVPASSDFEDLNDDWDISTHTSSRIALIDISGGNGGTDTLIFEKN